MLGELVREAHARADALRARTGELEARASRAPQRPSFRRALNGPTVAVIGEIKRASPSRGWIRPDADAAEQAREYQRGGAAAISVLTEPTRFAGSTADLESASAAVDIPLLRKDFIVSVEQILEARATGASAVLIIAKAVAPARAVELVRYAESLGLAPLLEVRTHEELQMSLDAGADLIGINARDLETLEVDTSLVPRLLAHLPPEVTAVAESGLSSRADIEALADAGVDAVLVGTAFSAATDPAAAVKALTGVPRKPRAAGS